MEKSANLRKKYITLIMIACVISIPVVLYICADVPNLGMKMQALNKVDLQAFNNDMRSNAESSTTTNTSITNMALDINSFKKDMALSQNDIRSFKTELAKTQNDIISSKERFTFSTFSNSSQDSLDNNNAPNPALSEGMNTHQMNIGGTDSNIYDHETTHHRST